MQKIRVEDAVGTVLMHDMTQIIPGQIKGPRFHKGQVIREEDIPVLLSMGKQHIYVWDQTPGQVHENEAAERLAKAIAGPGLSFSEPKEGKVDLIAESDGILYVDEERLLALDSLEYVVIATLHNHRPIRVGQKIAGTRVVPLMIDEKVIQEAEDIASGNPVIKVCPLKSWKVGIVTTGSEIYHGRIQDKFGPVLKKKMNHWGSEVIGQEFSDDNIEMIQDKIRGLIAQGAEMILVTGGMSVDPDDVTPTAIKGLGGTLVSYGSPVLPGAMFLLAYLDDIPVMGLPGCVMYAKTTVFDLIAPRILVGEKIERKDIARLGHGGLCEECAECVYPNCAFGK